MSPQIKDKCGYQDALARVAQKGKWADIDAYYAEALPYVDTDFRDKAVETALKARIRRDLKNGTVETEDGRRIKVANVVVRDSRGVPRRVYKDESLLDVADCVQVVRYWRDRRKYCGKRIRYYTKLAVKLHGVTIQGLLPLRD